MPKRTKTAATAENVWDRDPLDDSDVQVASPRKKKSGTETEIHVPEVSTEPGDIIDGSEDDVTLLTAPKGGADQSRVTAAVKAAIKAARFPKKETVTMADKKETKTDAIRAETERRIAAGESVRPRDIIAALATKGVTVTPPQVSVLVKKITGGKPAKAPAAEKTAEPKAEPRTIRAASAVKKPIPVAPKKPAAKAAASKPKAGGSDEPQYDLLFDAANFVGRCGSIDQARSTLAAYEKLLATRA